jgi:hypothetical protein
MPPILIAGGFFYYLNNVSSVIIAPDSCSCFMADLNSGCAFQKVISSLKTEPFESKEYKLKSFSKRCTESMPWPLF